MLRLLGTDLGGPEIARELVVSLNTVRTHTKNIYAKLGVNNRRAAVRRAEELDLLPRPPLTAAHRRRPDHHEITRCGDPGSPHPLLPSAHERHTGIARQLARSTGTTRSASRDISTPGGPPGSTD